MTTSQETSAPRPSQISDAFDLGSPLGQLVPVLGGQSHRMWRLETERGHYAVKALNRDLRNPGYMHWFDRAFRVELAAFEAGVSMPHPIPVPGTKRCLAELMGPTGRTATVRVHEWVDGINAARIEVTPKHARSVGHTLALIHGLDLKADASLDQVLIVHGSDHWRELAKRASGASTSWSDQLIAALPIVHELEEIVIESRSDTASPVLTHRDAHQKNFLFSAGGQLMLIDWDAAAPWLPSHEIAAAAIGWSGVYRADPDPRLAHAVIDGYQAAGGTMDALSPATFAGFFQILLSWLEFKVRRSLGERLQDPADREPAIHELLHTVGLLPRFYSSVDRWVSLLATAP